MFLVLFIKSLYCPPRKASHFFFIPFSKFGKYCQNSNGMIYSFTWETKEPGGLPSFFGGAYPPDEREEGVANVCYIL